MKYLPDEPIGFPVAGAGVSGTSLDRIGTSYYITLDQLSNIYISEFGNHRITKWWAGNSTAGTLVCFSERIFDKIRTNASCRSVVMAVLEVN